MITLIPIEDSWYISHNTQRAGIILSWASIPCSRVLDMDFTCWMHKSKETAGKNRDRVFFVVDVGQVRVSIDVICECLVANLVK